MKRQPRRAILLHKRKTSQEVSDNENFYVKIISGKVHYIFEPKRYL